MNGRTKRFMRAVLGEGRNLGTEAVRDPNPGFPFGRFDIRSVREWPFGEQAGMRLVAVQTPAMCTGERLGELVLTACYGGGLAQTELGVGLDLRLPSVDPDRVAGRSDHLLGQLVSQETASGTRGTVQVDFAERLPQGAHTFGIVKLRARVPWAADGRHVLHFHRQTPDGRTEAPHEEEDESALTGMTWPIPADTHMCLGLPLLTDDRTCMIEVEVGYLDYVLRWMQRIARDG